MVCPKGCVPQSWTTKYCCLLATHNFVICFANSSNRIWRREESRLLWTGLNHNRETEAVRNESSPAQDWTGHPSGCSAEQVVTVTKQTRTDSKQCQKPIDLATMMHRFTARKPAHKLSENGKKMHVWETSKHFQNSSIYFWTISLCDRWRGWAWRSE